MLCVFLLSARPLLYIRWRFLLSYAFSGDNTIDGLTINTDGSWSFDPANAAYNDLAKGETRAITVDYIVTDGSGETGSSSFTINLTGTNDIPVIDVIDDVVNAEP